MTEEKKISRRGVYYDLTISPYEFISPYGDCFKFSSEKKLQIYTRDIEKELSRYESFINRNGLSKLIPHEIKQLLVRAVYKSLYNKVES